MLVACGDVTSLYSVWLGTASGYHISVDRKRSAGTVEEVAKDAETFRSRRLRQMQAANEELLKRRSHHSTTAQDSTTRGTQQPAKEVKTTFFQVSGLTGLFRVYGGHSSFSFKTVFITYL